jgi:hypothetical protein
MHTFNSIPVDIANCEDKSIHFFVENIDDVLFEARRNGVFKYQIFDDFFYNDNLAKNGIWIKKRSFSNPIINDIWSIKFKDNQIYIGTIQYLMNNEQVLNKLDKLIVNFLNPKCFLHLSTHRLFVEDDKKTMCWIDSTEQKPQKLEKSQKYNRYLGFWYVTCGMRFINQDDSIKLWQQSLPKSGYLPSNIKNLVNKAHAFSEIHFNGSIRSDLCISIVKIFRNQNPFDLYSIISHSSVSTWLENICQQNICQQHICLFMKYNLEHLEIETLLKFSPRQFCNLFSDTDNFNHISYIFGLLHLWRMTSYLNCKLDDILNKDIPDLINFMISLSHDDIIDLRGPVRCLIRCVQTPETNYKADLLLDYFDDTQELLEKMQQSFIEVTKDKYFPY